jgi:hypothetical protein
LWQEGLAISNQEYTEEVIDDKALNEIKQKIRDLKEQIEEAHENFNTDRAEALEDEKEKLEKYLLSATGLMGRSRNFNNPSEKVRKNVTNQISRCIKRIQENHPTLGTHLKNSIKTGTLCSYSPDKSTTWEI